ncbi:hypothetical protein NP493_646g01082 [Ridgeia piscesae]|uniref:Cation efflux protein transmembrane domain-containing protein n=1 Tax=Ridgeia piscesae TaxID=27915 RepID=A0AAD9KSH7_RIDPI|nr:hypothetical protein NP493_646g01082 [Ridgeia piscesae]
MTADRQGKKILIFACFNVLCSVMLLVWCNQTNSMALTAYSYLTIFDLFRLLTCLISMWVGKQKPTWNFSFGYERFEVLAVFSSTLLAQLGGLFIFKESIERMLQQPEIHTGRLLMGTSVGYFFHLAVTYNMDNKAFNHVIEASSSSWLQEHVTDMSESICHVVPGLSKLLLPRLNPFALIGSAGAAALLATYIAIDVNEYYTADTWAAIWIAAMTWGTMFPMCVYSGKILLQTTPSYIIGQLDKCIREASTLDGVLEFRHEHFWTLAFGTMAGSVHVRIRRDADEQMVLSHVYHRLSNLLSVLTIQVFKDDWSRPSTYQILGDSSLLSKMRPGSTPPKMASHSHSHGPSGAAHSHSHNSSITHNITPELFAAPAYDTQRASPRTVDPLAKSSAFTSANLVTPPACAGHSHLGSGPVGGASQHAVELDSSKHHGHSHNHHGHSH